MEVGVTGRTEGADLQLDVFGKNPAELGNVHPGPTIDLWRKFFSHNVYAHGA